MSDSSAAGGGHLTAPRYRPEIDGLRAVAVIAVIGYHARLPGFSGGYVGVDIFFVISGFLITQLLMHSLVEGPRASIVEFYKRRARRILPALCAMLLASTVAALLLYFPLDLTRFGQSLALAAALLGNFGAWLDGGYFDPGERFTPLRHLWSIGVEEQFYLLYPLILLGLLRADVRARRAWMLLGLAASLAISYLAKDLRPIPNFYLLPTRAWELLAGALAALSPALSRGAALTPQLLSVLGCAALAYAIGMNRVIGFPGPGSLLACSGTALLVCTASSGTLAGRLLQSRPLVFTGLISYSLYLWHAPVLAFFAYYHVTEPGKADLAFTLAAVYLLAALSWACIEQPARKAVTPRPLLASAAAVAALVLVGVLMVRSGGFPGRFAAVPIAAPVDEAAPIAAPCAGIKLSEIAAGKLCSVGPPDAPIRVLVWGDSHAYALLPVYRQLAEEQGVHLYFGVMGACWPLLGAEAASAGEFWRARCMQFNQAMSDALNIIRPTRVILNAYWLDPGGAAESEFQRRDADQAALRSGVERTLRAAESAGASVCVVMTVPGYDYPVPYALAMAQRRSLDPDALGADRATAFAQYQDVEGIFQDLKALGRLSTVDPKLPLCPAGRCLLRAADGASLYRDASHLSMHGGQLVRATLARCLPGTAP